MRRRIGMAVLVIGSTDNRNYDIDPRGGTPPRGSDLPLAAVQGRANTKCRSMFGVDLVEHAIVAEMFRLGLGPAAEIPVDRGEVKLGEPFQIRGIG